MSVDALAAKLGKNRATIYRYESDTIEMPAASLDELLISQAERREKICEFLPIISDGLSIEGGMQKYVLYKAPAIGGELEADFRSLLLTLYQFNHAGQVSKMHTLRVLGELVSSMDTKAQEQLISYGEFLDERSQKRYGVSITHPYQLE